PDSRVSTDTRGIVPPPSINARAMQWYRSAPECEMYCTSAVTPSASATSAYGARPVHSTTWQKSDSSRARSGASTIESYGRGTSSPTKPISSASCWVARIESAGPISPIIAVLLVRPDPCAPLSGHVRGWARGGSGRHLTRSLGHVIGPRHHGLLQRRCRRHRQVRQSHPCHRCPEPVPALRGGP